MPTRALLTLTVVKCFTQYLRDKAQSIFTSKKNYIVSYKFKLSGLECYKQASPSFQWSMYKQKDIEVTSKKYSFYFQSKKLEHPDS